MPSGGFGFFSLIYRSRWRPSEEEVKLTWQYGQARSLGALAAAAAAAIEPRLWCWEGGAEALGPEDEAEAGVATAVEASVMGIWCAGAGQVALITNQGGARTDADTLRSPSPCEERRDIRQRLHKDV